jgi:hypothetical protein
MVPLFKQLPLLALVFACDPGPTLAVRTPAPTPSLAAAPEARPHEPDRPRRGERAKKRDRAAPREPPASPPASPPSSALPPCPKDSPLTFRSFGDGFLRTWCTGCHSSALAADERQGAPDDVNFDRGALYRPHAQAVYERAVLEAAKHGASASPMPPAGGVTEADRRRLAEWIACGSPGA